MTSHLLSREKFDPQNGEKKHVLKLITVLHSSLFHLQISEIEMFFPTPTGPYLPLALDLLAHVASCSQKMPRPERRNPGITRATKKKRKRMTLH